MILSELGLTQAVPALTIRVGSLAMRAHDAAASRNTLIEQLLQNGLLVHCAWQTQAVALPVRESPLRLERQMPIVITQKLTAPARDCAPPRHDLG
jgi:hypothetical protein